MARIRARIRKTADIKGIRSVLMIISMVAMSVLVFMSTVFIKQHVILDFFGAAIVAEAGRLIMEFLYANRCVIFEKRGKSI